MNRTASPKPAALVWLLYNSARVRRGSELIGRISCSMALDRIIVVWNGEGDVPADAAALRVCGAAVEVIRGTNHGREFGGYQDGVDHLRQSADGGVFFLNDTAGVHDFLPGYFVDALTAAARRLGDRHGVYAGNVDWTHQVLEVGGLTGSSWVRSNLFYLDLKALEALDWKIYSPEINTLIPGTNPDHFYDEELSQPMRDRLDHWLFKPGRKSWYGATPLTAANASFMAGKARAVLQEYYLSMRVVHAGGELSRTDMSTLQIFWFKLINRIGRELGYLK